MSEVDGWSLPFAAKITILNSVAESKGLNEFKPIDESARENPLPGPFTVHGTRNMESCDSEVGGGGANRKRSAAAIMDDFSKNFPKKVAKC